MKKIEIRQASLDDCSFVARCIAMALHIDLQEEWLSGFASICAREDVLYSQFGFKYESDCYAFGQNYWKWGLKM